LKKIFFIFFCLSLIILFFHSFFLHKIIHINLEKITEKKVKIENVNIDFKNQKLIINDLKILNDQNFEYKNIFLCKKIIINFKFFNIFKEIIFFEEIIFQNPSIYIEIKKNNLKLSDNISVLEKKEDAYKPKVYPKKTKDRNVMFKKVKILEPRANININSFYKYENLKLSNMNFKNVGTSTNRSIHFKKVFQIILSDIYLRIPNYEMRKELKDIYMSK
tara:strand:- start:270 stop:926 length:657 start_codon:yes stop_codon:yes gene_type:complete